MKLRERSTRCMLIGIKNRKRYIEIYTRLHEHTAELATAQYTELEILLKRKTQSLNF